MCWGGAPFQASRARATGESGASGKGREGADPPDKEIKRGPGNAGRELEEDLGIESGGSRGSLSVTSSHPQSVFGGLKSRPAPYRTGCLGWEGFGEDPRDWGILPLAGERPNTLRPGRGRQRCVWAFFARQRPRGPSEGWGMFPHPTPLSTSQPRAPGAPSPRDSFRDPTLRRGRRGAGRSGARDYGAAGAGLARSGGGGPTELPRGATRGSWPAPGSATRVRGEEGRGRGGAGRAAGEVISLPPPPPPLRSPPPPLRARPPRPAAAAAAAASASQTRSGSGSEAGVRGGWAGSPSGSRSAGKPGRPALAPRLRLRRPRPPGSALPGVGERELGAPHGQARSCGRGGWSPTQARPRAPGPADRSRAGGGEGDRDPEPDR